MRRALVVGLTATIALLVVALPSGLAQQLAPALVQAKPFLESFDGSPATPQDYSNPHNFDIMVFGVDPSEPNLAQHGPDCAAPGFPYDATNTHHISTAGQAVFLCKDHLMTAPGLAGYGAVYMTPPAVADFSGGSARISWDMSTLRTSSRDWVYVTLTPFLERHEMPFLNNDQHIPPHNIVLRLGGVDTFEVFQGRTDGSYRLNGQGSDYGTSWDDVFAAQKPPMMQDGARRDTFSITLTRTTVSLCLENRPYKGQENFCWARNVQLREPLDPAVWHDQANVQWTHVVYNAEKSCETDAIATGQYDANTVNDSTGKVHNPYGDLHCPPNTWHWDNMSINPSMPYSVIVSNPPGAGTTSPAPFAVSFSKPAPEGSYLNFVSWGDTPQLRVSFDQGRTWVLPHFQQATALDHPEVGENIFMPIPTGQTSAMVRGANGYWGSYQSYNFGIISPPAAAAPAPVVTPAPIATAVSAVSPTPETATLTPLPTATATLQPTATVAPTDTPVPTSAPTAAPTATLEPTPAPASICQVLVFEDGAPRLIDSDACSTP